MTTTADDISFSLEPRSDQVNADDLIAGPVTVTVVDVRVPGGEQPVHLVTDAFGSGRPYKPGLSMRRVLAKAWGKHASQYVGRRLTLYCDPDVKFGGVAVGGIRISAMSHIESRLSIPLTITRGKRAAFIVEPLPDAPSQPSSAGPDFDRIDAMIQAATDDDQLRDFWSKLSAMEGERAAASRDLVVARRAELQQQQDTPEDGQTTLAEIESEDQA